MADEINQKFCIEYCMRRGIPEVEAEKFSVVILCAYRQQTSKTLRQMCEFALETLQDIKIGTVRIKSSC